MARGRLLLAVMTSVVAACAAPEAQSPTPAPGQSATPTTAPPAPPPAVRVTPFDDAVVAAADTLFSQVHLAPGERKQLVIDPLVDGVSGMQSAATVLMGSRIAGMVRSKYPQFELLPLTASAIEQSPVVLVGTFTVINQKNEVLKEREAYRICLALADMKTGKILSKGVARAQLAGVDSTPTAFFRDSPAWARDKLVQGYVRTCQATKPGDPIDAVYGERIAAAAITAEAIDLYQNNQFAKSAALFRQAAATPSGNHLRNLNGWFAASMKVGNTKDATIATQRLVDYMLAERDLNFLFLFAPGTATVRQRRPGRAVPDLDSRNRARLGRGESLPAHRRTHDPNGLRARQRTTVVGACTDRRPTACPAVEAAGRSDRHRRHGFARSDRQQRDRRCAGRG